MTRPSRIALIAVLVLLAGALATSLYRNIIRRRQAEADGIYCTNQLLMLDTAKELAALKSGIMAGLPMPEALVARYCKDGVLPTCPSGGKYRLNIVGRNPMCSRCDTNQSEAATSCFHHIVTGE